MIKYKNIFLIIFGLIFPSILLLLMVINMYLLPHIIEIKVANLFNNKLYLNKDISITLPKNWYHSISVNGVGSRYGVIPKDFILKNTKEGKDFFYTFFNESNSGIIKFQDNLSFNLLKKFSKKEYDNQYCKFIAYHKGNQIHGIYIPSKESIIFFNKYNKNSKKFIEQLCKP